MKFLITTIVSVVMLLSLAVYAGDKGGNGGGGVIFDGRYMTFGSAGVKIGAAELFLEEIPQLRETLDFIANSKLSPSSKEDHFKALSRSFKRKYFKLDTSDLSEGVYQKIIEEYAHLTNLDPSVLDLYALTNIATKETFLLPRFFTLRPSEQMAILYHEAFWIMKQNATYKEVVQAEIAFQKYVEDRGSVEKMFNWLDHVGNYVDKMYTAIELDKSSKALAGLVDQRGYVRLSDLLGTDYVECATINFNGCNQYILPHLITLTKKYPSSYVLRQIQQNLIQGSHFFRDRTDWSTYRDCKIQLLKLSLGSSYVIMWDGTDLEGTNDVKFHLVLQN